MIFGYLVNVTIAFNWFSMLRIPLCSIQCDQSVLGVLIGARMWLKHLLRSFWDVWLRQRTLDVHRRRACEHQDNMMGSIEIEHVLRKQMTTRKGIYAHLLNGTSFLIFRIKHTFIISIFVLFIDLDILSYLIVPEDKTYIFSIFTRYNKLQVSCDRFW